MESYDDMGIIVFIFGIIIIGIWLALRDTEKKDKLKAEQAFRMQQHIQEQKAKDARFKKEFGDASFDYNDIALSEKVLEYTGADKNIEKVKSLASLFGGLKQSTAQAAAQATAAELKKQIEANRQNMQQQIPPPRYQQPAYIEPPRAYEPDPRRQRFNNDDEYYYQNPNRQRDFNHYS